MNIDLEILHIMPGYTCNLSCAHCVNESGPKRNESLLEEEILELKTTIAKLAPKRLVFTGGEPTLYISSINELIESHNFIDTLDVFITTNGWFAKNLESATKVLNSFKKITHLQLSYDLFHGSKLKIEDIKLLKNILHDLGIVFNISVCISSPSELMLANEIQLKTETTVIFQKIDASGRALKNNVEFKYPVFDPEVLEKQCPNLGQFSYISGKGFSTCCSNLIFNSNCPSFVFSKKLEHYMNGSFFKQISSKTFRQLAIEKNIDISNLSPSYSAPCRLCEYIFKE